MVKSLFSIKGVFTKLIIFLLLAIILMFMVHNVVIASQDVSKLEERANAPTIIYDQNGKIASKISTSKNEWVDYQDVPEYFYEALQATEDQNFYSHGGIDYFGIMRAAFKNVAAGGVVEGGSTLTQQLAKNTLLTQDQTFKRKFDEYFIAKKIEEEYSKEEILELYVNKIYFGEGAWGLKRAAKVYFGKEAADLTINESAILVGLIKAPTHYSPVKNLEKSLDRRDVVLSLMKKEKFITEEEMNEAKNEKVVLERKELDEYKGRFPFYVDHVIEEAIKKYGLTQNEILAGGFEIHTELRQDMQSSIEEVYKNDANFPESQSDQLVQSGAVLVNPKTGGVQALVGGRGEHSFRQFNRATQLKRQPGSTMKPIAVYTPALENGMDVYSKLKDEPLDIDGYSPKNFDGTYHGEVTMYEALIKSYNVPTVWALNEIGVQAGVDASKRFGLPISENDQNLSLGLGGLDKGVAPLNMAEAYTAFPNEGTRVEAHAITKIVDVQGNTIAEWKKKETNVTTKVVAQKMTHMMLGVVKEGTGKKAQLEKHELAGKTGSTQLDIDGIDGVKDQWFVGYTPNVVGAMWLGYDQTDQNNYLNTSSSATAAPLFKVIMDAALKNEKPEDFNLPPLKETESKSKKKKTDPSNEESKKIQEEKRKQEADEKAKRDEQERLKQEEKAKADAAKQKEEEQKQEQKRKEEQAKKEEEQAKKEEEQAKKEEEQARKEEEEAKKEEERRKEEERKKEEEKKQNEEKPAEPEPPAEPTEPPADPEPPADGALIPEIHQEIKRKAERD
ncbi:transglycosylase domain-containing protein [Bacillus sp. V2I10]|uniref:transglycosylase domain-containing protein n=1 Tax=Bacillus sp. V2I10 TaxID=3042276 RepID=UPI0027843555|nr:PBP1A family penicillin-binding protein [Bacillus sp. V2I10]MDQ0861421.1 penicillin-binding protein 2A [Bacillus sp. V2I10]